MKLTKRGDDIDSQLEPLVRTVVTEISTLKNLKSVMLFGGFGKGEGSVEMLNGKPRPFNDFDMYVFFDGSFSEGEVEEVAHKASAKIGKGGEEYCENFCEDYDANRFFHVDLRGITISSLPKLLPTIRTYEMAKSTQILWGKDVRSLIRPLTKSEIPFSEGIRNLTNKMGLLLMYASPKKLTSLSIDQKKHIIYISLKSYLSCCEALLSFEHEYAPTYSERLKKFPEIIKKHKPLLKIIPTLEEDVIYAGKLKLKPDFEAVKDPVAFYLKAKKATTATFKYLVGLELNLKGDNLEFSKGVWKKLPLIYFNPYFSDIFSRYHIPKLLSKVAFPAQYYLTLKYTKLLFKKHKSLISLLSYKDVGVRIMPPLYLYLSAFDGKTYDSSLIEAARKYTTTFIPSENDEESLRTALLDAIGMYYQQRLV